MMNWTFVGCKQASKLRDVGVHTLPTYTGFTELFLENSSLYSFTWCCPQQSKRRGYCLLSRCIPSIQFKFQPKQVHERHEMLVRVLKYTSTHLFFLEGNRCYVMEGLVKEFFCGHHHLSILLLLRNFHLRLLPVKRFEVLHTWWTEPLFLFFSPSFSSSVIRLFSSSSSSLSSSPAYS